MFHHQIFGFLLIVLQVLASIIDYTRDNKDYLCGMDLLYENDRVGGWFLIEIELDDGFKNTYDQLHGD